MDPTNTMDISPEEFERAGIMLVKQLSGFLRDLPGLPVTSAESPSELRNLLPDMLIPEEGAAAPVLLRDTASLLTSHSLFNGHPRFWGYITSSAAPIGALADLLAAVINANVGAQTLSPMATEIERQTIHWLGQLIGYHEASGGIFVSGGNMANFLGYLSARKIRGPKPGTNGKGPMGVAYCAKSTHTWIQKAVDLFGAGGDLVRWIGLNPEGQMDLQQLENQLKQDLDQGLHPFMVVGNAGTVETGRVDDLEGISRLCQKYDAWFHIDGAYGAPAASLPELQPVFRGLPMADSVAIDPHKWLYSPLEAGCILVKKPEHLRLTFSHQPEYYNFEGDRDDMPLNYYEYGLQNSRGFRALKVWLSIRQVGKKGIVGMIRKDIALAAYLFRQVTQREQLEAVSTHLSITTFRYLPQNASGGTDKERVNQINKEQLNRLQGGGEVFLSNAIVEGVYCLRVCIVNFRTSEKDLDFLLDKVIEEGAKLEQEPKS